MGEKNEVHDQDRPIFSVITQYIKDLSFESPNSPYCFDAKNQSPKIKINVQVNAKSLSDTDFDVVLLFDIEARNDEKVIFHLEITYGGIFRIANIPQEDFPVILFVECPRLLFPFIRQIITNLTRDSGFPPLMIDTIDFLQLFKQRKNQKTN
ncbi:protein-export chaperone SecB [Candidatus Liberibacter sp.]|uniref:protein-export chaperone SecB n=1 Tax=Candidatus Liberibacter sp. TaxID=34022 RepID=UPI0015F42150|nr:protein-export chaperone SecB [Candidatus Liberibacter sp.]MBA5723973.1 protein-export chaperone SecB [Candidatus Liberibacter sp.]